MHKQQTAKAILINNICKSIALLSEKNRKAAWYYLQIHRRARVMIKKLDQNHLDINDLENSLCYSRSSSIQPLLAQHASKLSPPIVICELYSYLV